MAGDATVAAERLFKSKVRCEELKAQERTGHENGPRGPEGPGGTSGNG